jgi:hypothetical protein
MNQELEALIKAYLAAGECALDDRARRQADFDARLEASLQKQPGVSREIFMQGIRRRARAFVKAQSHPPTVPPQA